MADIADGQTGNLGAGLLPTLALVTCITGAKFCVLLFSYMEIRILVPGLRVLLGSHVIIIVLRAERCAEPGGAAAELPQGACAFAKGKKKLYRRIFLI